MDEQFKKPLVVLLWTIVIVAVAFGILFVYGMFLGFSNPELYYGVE